MDPIKNSIIKLYDIINSNSTDIKIYEKELKNLKLLLSNAPVRDKTRVKPIPNIMMMKKLPDKTRKIKGSKKNHALFSSLIPMPNK